jgi:hypothetical protein
MRKRKMGGGTMDGAPTATFKSGGSPSRTREQGSNYGCVAGIQPAARDGHSSDICEQTGLMFIFGGDRHHMPFNDLYVMKL